MGHSCVGWSPPRGMHTATNSAPSDLGGKVPATKKLNPWIWMSETGRIGKNHTSKIKNHNLKKKKNETTTNQQKFEKKESTTLEHRIPGQFFQTLPFWESVFSTRSPQRYPLKGAVDVHGQDAAPPLKLCCSEIQLLGEVDGAIRVMMLMWLF